MSDSAKVTYGHGVSVCRGCILTALSMPSVSSIMKKITAQIEDPGNVAMASG